MIPIVHLSMKSSNKVLASVIMGLKEERDVREERMKMFLFDR